MVEPTSLLNSTSRQRHVGEAIQTPIDDKRDLISRIEPFPSSRYNRSGHLVKMQSPKPPDSECSACSDLIGSCRDTLGKSSIDSLPQCNVSFAVRGGTQKALGILKENLFTI